MRREVTDCDRCKTPNLKEPVTLNIVVGSHMCPSGNGTETDTERVDLCYECAGKTLSRLVNELGEAEASKWVRHNKA